VLFYQIGGFLVELCKGLIKTEEENWFKWSQWAVFITLGLIVLVIILIACNIFESHDTYIVYIFSSIVTCK
jgi:hypothetical protein